MKYSLLINCFISFLYEFTFEYPLVLFLQTHIPPINPIITIATPTISTITIGNSGIDDESESIYIYKFVFI